MEKMNKLNLTEMDKVNGGFWFVKRYDKPVKTTDSEIKK